VINPQLTVICLKFVVFFLDGPKIDSYSSRVFLFLYFLLGITYGLSI